MFVTATLGELTINKIYASDGNYAIYGRPENYTFEIGTKSGFSTDLELVIQFPDDFRLVPSFRCDLGNYNIVYRCVSYNETRQIVISDFMTYDMGAGELLNFTVDSIINPGPETGYSWVGDISIYSRKKTDLGIVDSGTYTFDYAPYYASNITHFEVLVNDTSVGHFPSNYTFRVRPNGEVARGSYMEIIYPEETEISSESHLETRCGSRSYNFTYNCSACYLHCKLTKRERMITVYNGFQQIGTDHMFDNEPTVYDLEPGTLDFDILWFRNPRSLLESG